jgi:hypothetical protein
MARIRSIKPAFFASRSVHALPFRARLTYIGAWTYVDDEGRGVDDARLVKAAVWPLDDNVAPSDVEEDLDMLARLGFIRRYKAAGQTFFAVIEWKKHQSINRPRESIIPAPRSRLKPPGDSTAPSVNGHGDDSAGIRSKEGNKEGEGSVHAGGRARGGPAARKLSPVAHSLQSLDEAARRHGG